MKGGVLVYARVLRDFRETWKSHRLWVTEFCASSAGRGKVIDCGLPEFCDILALHSSYTMPPPTPRKDMQKPCDVKLSTRDTSTLPEVIRGTYVELPMSIDLRTPIVAIPKRSNKRWWKKPLAYGTIRIQMRCNDKMLKIRMRAHKKTRFNLGITIQGVQRSAMCAAREDEDWRNILGDSCIVVGVAKIREGYWFLYTL
jgi:hypothetical protein